MATLPEILTPRKGTQIRYAVYFGHEGYATITEAREVIFRTAQSLWTPVVNVSELTVLGEVGDSECQRALDNCAGGFAAVCTSRRLMEV